jgi:acyl carrier protein
MSVDTTKSDTSGDQSSESEKATCDKAASDKAASDKAANAIDAELRQIMCDVLGLDSDDVAEFDAETGLFGHLPELDSMAVAGLLTEMEDRLDIMIDDEDVDGEMLETYGGLLGFAQAKVAEG